MNGIIITFQNYAALCRVGALKDTEAVRMYIHDTMFLFFSTKF